VYGKARRISTASGSERDSTWSTLATARGTDPYTHLITDLTPSNRKAGQESRAGKPGRKAGQESRAGKPDRKAGRFL